MKTRLSWMFKSATAAAAVALSVASLSTQAADTIKIGMMTESTGPSSEAGIYQANGAKLALDEINQSGGVLGRQFELRNEDNQSTNPGSVLAISKLTSGADLTALIATVRSTQIQAISPTVMRARLPILVGGTDVGLTHANNPWIFRARPNDGYSARVIADYGLNTLKLKKWAIIHSTDAFGNGGKNSLTESLKAAGVTPVLVQGFTSNSQDFTPIVLAIKNSGADIVSTYIANSTDVAIFAKQLRQLGVKAAWVGSPSVSTDTAMKLAGDALHGSYSIADFSPGSSAQAQAYADKYRAAYKVDPDFYSAWAYDSVKLLALAIKNANSTKPDDIAKALHAIKDYKGVEGAYTFDANGDGLHGYNIVRNDGGKIVFVKHIDFGTQ
ncbi:Branched-chain amino acid ABC transporter, amino acid-binding protein (TC 3.A.1.4.1) [Caballeronia glathei]|uniref:ABC transporter substrate-binding protein n=1 Tax=Caballeronia glathei TaxID=60547 RepID=A0A069PMG9_9BURK|nr:MULTISPECIES: ABC transporter substrate-binding protein [Burkholderiaceae]KDR41893.1 ABC transporter substrate-binding protein [Caballeronia glathei]TCK36612.1 amino acid/amide ABC transporter substrate-binding protein (HAAT family) [Paraburkholderia sp. BL8N3]CDY77078.1 Branched-chain amino acid ABC transporter, amino acid-binding protein (TC 3.A.1.4.1) [Caballeronia glathei]